jgi:hypothetical protein
MQLSTIVARQMHFLKIWGVVAGGARETVHGPPVGPL